MQYREIKEDLSRRSERYLVLAAMDHVVVGRVLRAHLIIENFMNSDLVDLFHFEDFHDLRTTSYQKAKMLPQCRASAAGIST